MVKILPIAVAVTLLWPAGAKAQDPAVDAGLFSQSVEIRVVNVDVHVTDKKGRPVTGLTRDDFVVTEDGAPVEIAYFYDSQGVAAPQTNDPPSNRAVPSSYVRAEDLVVVIYIDNYWLLPADRKRVLDDIERFVARTGSGLVVRGVRI